MIRYLFLFPLSGAVAVYTAGCQSVLGIEDTYVVPDAGTLQPDASESSDGSLPPDAQPTDGFSFAVVTPKIGVPLGGMNPITVQVQRFGSFSGPIEVAAENPPNGLTIAPATIAAGQSLAEVVIGAQVPFAVGDTVSFTLGAVSGGERRTAMVTDAPVTGTPGTLDQSFGAAATGVAFVSFGSDDAGSFEALKIINDQILAIGTGFGGLGGARFVLSRLNTDGLIDAGFNGGAMVRTGWASSAGDSAHAFAIGRQNDGELIAIGWRELGLSEPPDIALANYQSTGPNAGQLGDRYFGLDGKSLVNLGGQEKIYDGLVLPTNQIIAVGEHNSRFLVARIDAQGFLDTSFASPNGYLLPIPSTGSVASAVAVDQQGRLVVVGQFGGDIVVFRCSGSGVPDAGFGQGGVLQISSPGDERAVAVSVLSDGRLVVAGDAFDKNGARDFVVYRLLADGTPDESFGTSGRAFYPITADDDQAADMVVIPDGRIVVVGNVRSGSDRNPVIARYTTAGALDPYFGIGGVTRLDVSEQETVNTVEVLSDHKILIGGDNGGATPGPGLQGIIASMWM